MVAERCQKICQPREEHSADPEDEQKRIERQQQPSLFEEFNEDDDKA